MLAWVLIQYDCVYRKDKFVYKLTQRERERERKHHMKIKAEMKVMLSTI